MINEGHLCRRFLALDARVDVTDAKREIANQADEDIGVASCMER